jgi:hypothetical protein
MKTPTVKMLGLIASLLLSVTAQASDRWETLRAINWVENPTNHTRRGAFGELGPYQFRPQTWRMHTTKPFAWAVERAHADEVAVKHYEWLRRELREAGIDPSPYNIALAWNSGLGAVTNGRVPRVTYDYANRVSNLVAEQKSRQTAGVVTLASSPKRGRPAPKPAAMAFNVNKAPLLVFNPKGSVFSLPAPLSEPAVTGDIPVVRASASGSLWPLAALPPAKTETPFVVGAATPMFALPE